VVFVSPAALRTDLQIRVAGIDEAHVTVLAGLDGDLPPIVVHRPSLRVIDGVHRLAAVRARGAGAIPAVLVDGDDVDALVLAVRLNAKQGMPLTRRDRNCAIHRLLDARPEWSDRRIARIAGVSHRTVGAARRRASGESARSHSVGSDGRRRPLNIAERRRQAAALIVEQPDASAREIARTVGLSPGTVLDVRRRGAERGQPVPPRPAPAARAAEPDSHAPARDIEVLSADPTLRYSLAGCFLLRLLHGTLSLRQSADLVSAIPAHARPSFARLARASARRWWRIADDFEFGGREDFAG
jgi:ParB-like chromosome segregation protein Spo0J